MNGREKVKRIIHLSDLHIGYSDMLERFRHIVGMISELRKPSSDYVIVITGDLVERAADENYSNVKEPIEHLQELGYRVLVVPGNHDYSKLRIHWKKNVKKFKKTFFDNTKITYPKLDIIGDAGEEKIAFLGLDSMAEELHWYDSMWFNGELGEKQRERLRDILSSSEVENCEYKVVYLHHHPFDPKNIFHKLKDDKEFCRLIEDYVNDGNKKHNIDALLFGHNHEENRPGENWNGYIQRIPRCYDAGTSTRKNNVPCIHRVINLSRDTRLDYDGDFLRNYLIKQTEN